jgi:hypothetical protein
MRWNDYFLTWFPLAALMLPVIEAALSARRLSDKRVAGDLGLDQAQWCRGKYGQQTLDFHRLGRPEMREFWIGAIPALMELFNLEPYWLLGVRPRMAKMALDQEKEGVA